MTPELPFIARTAQGEADLDACIALRSKVFRDGECDRDSYDPLCQHIMVEDRLSRKLLCCFRVMAVDANRIKAGTYCGESYGLEGLSSKFPRMLEMGRFCMDSANGSPDLLRVAWGKLAKIVVKERVQLLFGCSSFSGTDPGMHADSFSYLCQRHLAPNALQPRRTSSNSVSLQDFAAHRASNANLPGLLRFYLSLGAMVSDHATIDPELGTIHVLTLLPVENISPIRKRTLLALAGN